MVRVFGLEFLDGEDLTNGIELSLSTLPSRVNGSNKN
jgi:hypothetical protein